MKTAPVTPREFCRAWLPRVSRTFGLNIRVLPEPLRGAVQSAYLLCRIADTIEDEGHLDAGQRMRLLEQFAECVRSDDPQERDVERLRAMLPGSWKSDRQADRLLVSRTQLVLQEYARLPAPARRPIGACVREMCSGMARHAMQRETDGWLRLESVTELLGYCHRVAGTVGLMLCELFAWHDGATRVVCDETLRARAAAFGVGLQLVNIARDMSADWRRKTVFVPAEMAHMRGFAAGSFPDPGRPRDTEAVLRDLLALAHAELLQAQRYVMQLPRSAARIRLFCLWPLLTAQDTLALLARRSEGALDSERPRKVGRWRVFSVVCSGVATCRSNALLMGLFGVRNRRLLRLLRDHMPPCPAELLPRE